MVDKDQHERALEPLENDSFWHFTTNRPNVSRQNWAEELSEYASDDHGRRGHGYRVTGRNDRNKGEIWINYDRTPQKLKFRLIQPLSKSITKEISDDDNLRTRYEEAAYRAQAEVHSNSQITVPNSDRLKGSGTKPLRYELMATSNRNITNIQSKSEVANMAKTFEDICKEVEDEWEKVR